MAKFKGCYCRHLYPEYLKSGTTAQISNAREGRWSSSNCSYCVSGRSTGKEKLSFFRFLKLTEKVEATLVSPGRPLEDQSTDRLLVLAPTRRMQAGSSISKTPAQLTLAAKGNCFVLRVGNQDTARECISNKFSTRKNEGNNRYSKSQETGKSSCTYTEADRRNTHHQENL